MDINEVTVYISRYPQEQRKNNFFKRHQQLHQLRGVIRQHNWLYNWKNKRKEDNRI